MGRDFDEADWKVFREVRENALERFCDRVLSEIGGISAETRKSSHERYLAVYKLLQKRDKKLAVVFDNPRRSTALLQLLHIMSQDLLTEEEFERFSPDLRERVRAHLDLVD